MVNDVVYAAEVIGSLHDIINLHSFVRDADGVCLKDVSGLLVGQTAAFDMVRVVSQVKLRPVVYATLDMVILLLTKSRKKG